MPKTTILIVDDHNVVIEGIRRTLDYNQEVEVVGEACDGAQAIEKVKELHPDMVIMDISMPDMDGLYATRQIKQFAPNIKIIIFSAHFKKDLLISLFTSGISGYVLKQDHISELILAIDAVRAGGTYFTRIAPAVLLTHMSELESKSLKDSQYGRLTRREREIFIMLADGYSSKEIAEKLEVSKKTIDAHKYKIMKKLDVKTSSELTKIAVRRGLLNP
ncbi:putative Oxygen regulatory protein NreC [uncultured Desulfobacterium sp.]|uniref:Putative Oxygen regulatory protein NreC n=1 Tax=uncultured Desulfobacterium sp. TaxID=201089 RepID=A0A445MX09_9BACT|nr:putative Oxygen regulatory protein NreC [uncultured Desulfobacterium sp.]